MVLNGDVWQRVDETCRQCHARLGLVFENIEFVTVVPSGQSSLRCFFLRRARAMFLSEELTGAAAALANRLTAAGRAREKAKEMRVRFCLPGFCGFLACY